MRAPQPLDAIWVPAVHSPEAHLAFQLAGEDGKSSKSSDGAPALPRCGILKQGQRYICAVRISRVSLRHGHLHIFFF